MNALRALYNWIVRYLTTPILTLKAMPEFTESEFDSLGI
jgi:hypothetical protein